ncbi:hypothetical protein AB7B51_17485 [Acinetobacter baumannii]|uniref:hypothetical protein n=1 Tax=Acinetobacter baumannii TaxID=470 RepID=UPI0034E29B83
MKLSYFITDREDITFKDDKGADIYARTIAIQDEDRRKDDVPCVIESWGILFSLDNETEIIAEQTENAQNAIAQVNRYIACQRFMQLRREIAANLLRYKEENDSQGLKRENARMVEIQSKLAECRDEYNTLLSVMKSHNVGIDDISDEWVADMMINAKIMRSDRSGFLNKS